MFSLLFEGSFGDLVAPTYGCRLRELLSRGNVANIRKYLLSDYGGKDSQSHPLDRCYEDLGLAPIHMAITIGSTELVTTMMILGCDIQALSATGDTPLHFAMGLDQVQAAETLMLLGADVTATNSAGYIPLDVCVSGETRDHLAMCASRISARTRSTSRARHAGVGDENTTTTGDYNSNKSNSNSNSNGMNSAPVNMAFVSPGDFGGGVLASPSGHGRRAQSFQTSAPRVTTPLESDVLQATYDTAANARLEVHGKLVNMQRSFLGAMETYGKELFVLSNKTKPPTEPKAQRCQAEMARHLERMKKFAHERPELIVMRHSATLFMQVAAPAGATPLHYAASLGADEVVEWLLTFDEVSAWARDMQGRTPLHYAAREGHEPTCWLLRRAMQQETNRDPVGPAAPADLTGTTPLGYATLMAADRRGGRPADGVVEALYCPGDVSILPRSPQRQRSGHTPLPSSPSPRPLGGQAERCEDGSAMAPARGLGLQSGSLVYATSEAMGWRPHMEDRSVTACPMTMLTPAPAGATASGDGGRDEAHGAATSVGVLAHCALFAVLDGHGGSEVSDALAEMLPERMAASLHSLPTDTVLTEEGIPVLTATLTDVCMSLDRELALLPPLVVTKTQRGASAGCFAGSTMVASLVTPLHILVSNVGDSRAVLARVYEGVSPDALPLEGTAAHGLVDGHGPSSSSSPSPPSVEDDSNMRFAAIALSKDHTLLDEKERSRAVEAGGEVRRLEYANPSTGETVVNYEVWSKQCPDHRLRMARSFGDFYCKLDDDRTQRDQIVTCTPDIHIERRLSSDAFLILACDGIWDVCTNQEAVSFLGPRITQHMRRLMKQGLANDWVDAAQQACATACDELIEECFTRGSTDNMTLMVVLLAHVTPQGPFSFRQSTRSRLGGATDSPRPMTAAALAQAPDSAVQALPSELLSPAAAEEVGIGNGGQESPVKPRHLFTQTQAGWFG